MFIDQVKLSIHDFTETALQSNPLSVGANAGKLTAQNINTYLSNLSWIFTQHSLLLKKAAVKARNLKQLELAEFIDEKYEEERDHHLWPEQDLQRRGVEREGSDQTLNLLASSQAIIQYLDTLIDSDPVLMLPYLTLVEYFTVLGAPRFIAALESKCGIRRTDLTAIDFHAVADVKHVDEDLLFLEKWATDAEKQNAVMGIIRKTGAHVDRFLADCAL